VATGKKVSRKAPPASVESNTSVRTLILGIDRTGRIVQHDRTAPKILARSTDDLLGVHLSDITANPSDKSTGFAIAMLLEAVKSDREGNAVLNIALSGGQSADAVVTAKPMQTGTSDVAAFVIMQIPIPSAERFIDPALMRDILLRDTASPVEEDTLDFSDLAKKMTGQLVPAFCTAAEVLVLESLIGDNEMPEHGPDGNAALRRLHLRHDDEGSAWNSAFPVGEVLRFPPASPYTRSIETLQPVIEHVTVDSAKKLAKSWRRNPLSGLLTDVSMLILPAVYRGTVLGLFVCFREAGTRRFDRYDLEMGMEFAARSAVFFNHATRYNREHATALTLQRAMLPLGLTFPSMIEVKHRYLPGSELVEVGGDWYESIRLPGARVALVVGDVAGHGVRAAVTMGRLRTAIQTLAMLELAPAESLQQLDLLMQTIGEREPHFATCAYAVYDGVTGEIELATAGHLPPLLVHPDGTNEYLEVTPSPPLGVGNGDAIDTKVIKVEDGSLFVLYTDGLVESRDRDIQDGLDRLQATFGEGAPEKDLEDLCKLSLDGVYADAKRDDIAVLIAKLRRIPEDHRACLQLQPKLESVRDARAFIRDPLKRWGLEDLTDASELLVSELVTNAIRYASTGEITLRVILEPDSLVCEVHDSSPALPRVLQVDKDAENGRGLHVVSQLATKWGARRTLSGKVVWCEQPVPEAVTAAIMEALGTSVGNADEQDVAAETSPVAAAAAS
jgi:anti-sigma regulatory factor (Ser/Thr protein kinase)